MRDWNIDGVVVGRPYQDINEVSTVQRYPVGMIHERHGRRWRYCRAVQDILFAGRGCPNLAFIPWHSENTYACGDGDLIAITVAGQQKIVVKVDDCAVANCRTKDYFVGGMAIIFCLGPESGGPATNILQFRISGNDVSVANTDTDYEDITVYLDEPLPQDLAALDQVDLYPSPYMNIGYSESVSVHGRVACVPMNEVASGSWFWGQTRGPCWCTPVEGITAAVTHEMAFTTDGAVIPKTACLQLAGYMLHYGDGTQDDSLLMLQIE